MRDRSGDLLVPLDQLADARFGFKTGVDKFFCVRDVTEDWLQRLPDPHEFQRRFTIRPQDTRRIRIVRDGERGEHLVEVRFLEPEFHTLQEAHSIVIRAEDVKRLVINAPVSRAALRDTHLERYVQHAEQRGWHTGSTVRQRAASRPWYDLGLRDPDERAQMFWPKAHQYRHIAPWNQDMLPCKDRIFDIWALAEVNPRTLWAALNSSIAVLSKHQYGRPAGIEGNLDTDVVDVEMMLVPDVRRAAPEAAARAVVVAERMAQRSASRYLWEEFELDDRQELDDAVLEILGIVDPAERVDLRQRIYDAIRELQQATREREVVAQADRRRSARRGRVSPQDIADEIWEEHWETFGLLEFPQAFVLRPGQGEQVDLPPGAVEVGTALMDGPRALRAGTVRLGGPTGQVQDVGSVHRARFLEALALCGRYGSLRLPDEAECEQAVAQFESYRQSLTQRLSALATQRTRDVRRQRAVADALMRRALAWHPSD